MDTPRHWANDIYDVFKRQRIALVSYVPDAGHVPLLNLCQADPDIRLVSLRTEEEGIPPHDVHPGSQVFHLG